MRYRAVVYYACPGQAPENGTVLRSGDLPTPGHADKLLDNLLKLPGVTGGHIEVNVPGIGWVKTDDVETALWLHKTSQ